MTRFNAQKWLAETLVGGRLLELILEYLGKAYIRENDIVIDGGANRGRHTFPMAKSVGATGQVYAIEAIPKLARALEEKVTGMPVTIINQALGSSTGRAQFSICVDRDTRSGLHARKFAKEYGIETIEIDVITIDRIIGNQNLSFLKLDIEGGEFDALKGAIDTLKRDSPLIVFEHGGREGASLYHYTNQQYYRFLANNGYAVSDMLGRTINEEQFISPDVWYFVAHKQDNQRHQELMYQFPALVAAAARDHFRR